MYGSRFLRDFGDSVPDAWRAAVSQLQDWQITRGLERLTRHGNGSSPTLPQFVKACREASEHGGPVTPSGQALPAPVGSSLDAFGQRCMMIFLMSNHAREDQLPRLIAVKNETVRGFEVVMAEEPDTPATAIRDELMRRLSRVLAA
jgi:hypothetical protein